MLLLYITKEERVRVEKRKNRDTARNHIETRNGWIGKHLSLKIILANTLFRPLKYGVTFVTTQKFPQFVSLLPKNKRENEEK